MIAGPVAMAIGGPISGLILRLNWLDLPGWRWVFILEGVPAVLFGFITLYAMSDRPEQATWLETQERQAISALLEAEKREKKAAYGKSTVWQAVRQPTVLILALIWFLKNIGTVAFLLWLPSIVQKASGLSPRSAAILSGLPFAVAVIGVKVWSWSSDRTGKPLLHTFLPLLLASCFFSLTAIPGQPLPVVVLELSLTSAAIFSCIPSFFVLPTLTLDESAAAGAIGFINSVGVLGGFVGPTAVGYIMDGNLTFSVATIFLSSCFLAAALLTFLLRGRFGGNAKKSPPCEVESVVVS